MFGVCADWLLGRNEIKFSDTTLSPIESALLKDAKTLDYNPVPLGFFRLFVYESGLSSNALYSDPKKRARYYSLEERGEVAFCLNVLYCASPQIVAVEPGINPEEVNFETFRKRLAPKLAENHADLLSKLKERIFKPLKERDGKTTTLARLALWEECKNKIYDSNRRH